jgi:hypothetical protein
MAAILRAARDESLLNARAAARLRLKEWKSKR